MRSLLRSISLIHEKHGNRLRRARGVRRSAVVVDPSQDTTVVEHAISAMEDRGLLAAVLLASSLLRLDDHLALTHGSCIQLWIVSSPTTTAFGGDGWFFWRF